MSPTTNDPVAEHGWTAVPLDAEAIFKGKPYLHKPTPVLVKDIHFPSDDPLVAKAQQYAKEQLPQQTYNHSMRIFYWATVILHQQFPAHAKTLSPSTLALASLLHDLGTAPAFLTTTHLSFEYNGAIAALNLLTSPAYAAPRPQAEAVCEAIIRHQELAAPGASGAIGILGQLIQLATVYDNIGGRAYLVDEVTRGDVNRVFGRKGWAGCFVKAIGEEMQGKPWCHSTCLGEGFVNAVEGNLLMEGYE